ncbi:MAG TPA: hypothetical protein PKB13_03225 [Clostridia bacterium]|nr:hypothetical protein [Clostridia bacterium]
MPKKAAVAVVPGATKIARSAGKRNNVAILLPSIHKNYAIVAGFYVILEEQQVKALRKRRRKGE